MAGRGDRFVDKGYTNPKPLIKVNGKMIIEYILVVILLMFSVCLPIYFKRKNAVTHHSNVCSVEWCLALLNRFVLLEKQCKRGTNPDPFSLIGQSLLGIAISLSRQRV